jgi:hypothetical protein
MAELNAIFLTSSLMEHRGTEDIGRDGWIWTVDLDEKTTESGRQKTREAALTTVVLTKPTPANDNYLPTNGNMKSVGMHGTTVVKDYTKRDLLGLIATYFVCIGVLTFFVLKLAM